MDENMEKPNGKYGSHMKKHQFLDLGFIFRVLISGGLKTAEIWDQTRCGLPVGTGRRKLQRFYQEFMIHDVTHT